MSQFASSVTYRLNTFKNAESFQLAKCFLLPEGTPTTANNYQQTIADLKIVQLISVDQFTTYFFAGLDFICSLNCWGLLYMPYKS